MFVYIIIHPAYPGWVKIGRSIQPKKRLENYQIYDPGRSYVIYFKRKTNKIAKIERFFVNHIESNGHEWFKISKVLAKKIILTMVKSGNGENAETLI